MKLSQSERVLRLNEVERPGDGPLLQQIKGTQELPLPVRQKPKRWPVNQLSQRQEDAFQMWRHISKTLVLSSYS